MQLLAIQAQVLVPLGLRGGGNKAVVGQTMTAILVPLGLRGGGNKKKLMT